MILQPGEMGLLPDCHDDPVRRDGELGACNRLRPAAPALVGFSHFHPGEREARHLSARNGDADRRAPEFDPDTLLFRLADLRKAGGHIAALAAVVDRHGPGPETDGGPCRVEGGVAAADDGHVPRQGGHLAGMKGPEHFHGAEHPLGLIAGDTQAQIPVGSRADKNCPESFVEQPLERLDRCARADLDSGLRDGLDLDIENGPGQAEGVDAQPEHPPGLVVGLEDRDGKSRPVEIMGGRESCGAGADDGDSFGLFSFPASSKWGLL